jgi:hypothetical protein
MQRATVIGSHAQNEWLTPFAQGLMRHGVDVTMARSVAPNPRTRLLVVWGVRRVREIQQQLHRHCQVCVLERGYVGDRFRWTSVSFGGGLNGRGIYYGPFDDCSRWKAHHEHLMKPWRAPGDGRPLLLKQIPGDMSLRGADVERFYSEARRAFPELTVREHPRTTPAHGDKHAAGLLSLQDDLARASFAITWNSNSAVDAVLAGVPAIAMDRGSMAWDVTGHTLAVPPALDREAWAHALAWKQWTMDEISSGHCWEVISAHKEQTSV